jgi:ribosomal protein L7/L12
MKITIIIEDETRVEVSREFASLSEEKYLEVAKIVWENAHPITKELTQERHFVITRVPSSLKIAAIKILRNYSGITLKDAKDFIELGPCSGVPKVFRVSLNPYNSNPTIEGCASELMRSGISCGFYTDDEIATLEVMTS